MFEKIWTTPPERSGNRAQFWKAEPTPPPPATPGSFPKNFPPTWALPAGGLRPRLLRTAPDGNAHQERAASATVSRFFQASLQELVVGPPIEPIMTRRQTPTAR